jgi:hypothetical protein
VKYSKSQPLRANAGTRSSVVTLIKSKKGVVTRINFMQAQVEEKYFIFNLEYKNVALSREIAYGLSIKYQYSNIA